MIDLITYDVDQEQSSEVNAGTIYALGADNYVYSALLPRKEDISNIKFTKSLKSVSEDGITYPVAIKLHVYQGIIYVREFINNVGYIFCSKDSGNTWNRLQGFDKTDSFYFYVSKNTGYLYQQTEDKTVAVSKNGGVSWEYYPDSGINELSEIKGSPYNKIPNTPSMLAVFENYRVTGNEAQCIYLTLEDEIKFQKLMLPKLPANGATSGPSRFLISDVIFDDYAKMVYVFSVIEHGGIIIDYFNYMIEDNKLVLPESGEIKTIINQGDNAPNIFEGTVRAPDVIDAQKGWVLKVAIMSVNLNSPSQVSFRMYNMDANQKYFGPDGDSIAIANAVYSPDGLKRGLPSLQLLDNFTYCLYLDGDAKLYIAHNDTEFSEWSTINPS